MVSTNQFLDPNLLVTSPETGLCFPVSMGRPRTASPPPTTWPRQVAGLDKGTLLTHELTASFYDPSSFEALQQLRTQLVQQGYLYLQQLLPLPDVELAREAIAHDLLSNGFIAPCPAPSPAEPLWRHAGLPRDASPNLLERQDLQRHPAVSAVLEHPILHDLMSDILNPEYDDALKLHTHPYKWLRAVPLDLYTGPHVDQTYFPPDQYPRLLTAWIPLTTIPTSLGSLMVAPDLTVPPRQLEKGGDGTKSGWIGEGMGLETTRWESADMQMGDVVIICPQKCLHMSARNVEVPEQWRISCDTRWWVQ